jgi:hypothetical protein
MSGTVRMAEEPAAGALKVTVPPSLVRAETSWSAGPLFLMSR